MAHKPNKAERLARSARLNEPPRPEAKPRSWTLLFFRNALLWAVPVALLWTALTPFYNRFLLGSAQNLVRLTESPSVTRPVSGGGSLRLHLAARLSPFAHASPLLLPGDRRPLPPADARRPLPRRAAHPLAAALREPRLGGADHHLLRHLPDLLLRQVRLRGGVGDWSLAHYGPFARNFYGLGEHLLDLPFKFSLPFVLWAAFYYRDLTAGIKRPEAKKAPGT